MSPVPRRPVIRRWTMSPYRWQRYRVEYGEWAQYAATYWGARFVAWRLKRDVDTHGKVVA